MSQIHGLTAFLLKDLLFDVLTEAEMGGGAVTPPDT